jgi:tetratricopeptide (TPR) repeat protein
MKKRVGLPLLALVLCVAFPAVGSEKDEAKQLFESGLKLMKIDDFAAAAANFERSTALFATQNSLFNLANCYQAMRRYGDALTTLERLDHDFGKALKPEIKSAAARREAEIRSLVARLTVQVEPIDASLTVDGKDTGTGLARGPLLLAPGDHILEAIRVGYRTQRWSISLVSGKEQLELVRLEAEPTPAPVPSAFSAQVPPVAAAPTPDLATSAIPEPAHKSRALRIVAWSTLAGALAAGATAGGFWLIARGHHADFLKYNNADQANASKLYAAKSDGQNAQDIAIGCGIAAAALAVTSGITYWLGRDSGQDTGLSSAIHITPFGLAAAF